MKSHRIVIETTKAGRGTEVLRKESCPFKKGGDICTLESIECRYGLTEVKVPLPVCPLKMGVTQKITIEEFDNET